MAIAASVTLAVVMGGQALLPTADLAPAPLVSDIGGAVVPVMVRSLSAQALTRDRCPYPLSAAGAGHRGSADRCGIRAIGERSLPAARGTAREGGGAEPPGSLCALNARADGTPARGAGLKVSVTFAT